MISIDIHPAMESFERDNLSQATPKTTSLFLLQEGMFIFICTFFGFRVESNWATLLHNCSRSDV